ncbi:hypothetical protein BH18THE2_BH18THE2_09280 [soil metagenome]
MKTRNLVALLGGIAALIASIATLSEIFLKSDDSGNVISPDPSANNIRPTAEVGGNKEVKEGDRVLLYGTDSGDRDGTIDSYSWVQTGGTLASLSGSNTDTLIFNAPSVLSTDTVMTFKLTVTDDAGLTDTDTTNVIVKSVNEAPTTEARSNVSTFQNKAVIIRSNATDPEKDPTSPVIASQSSNIDISKLSGKIDVGSRPMGIAVNSKENLIYVANSNSSTVSVIDGSTNKLLPEIIVENPRYVAVNPESNMTYVTNEVRNEFTGRDPVEGILPINGNKDNRAGRSFVLEDNKTITSLAANPVTNAVYVATAKSTANFYFGSHGSLILLQGGLREVINITEHDNTIFRDLTFDEGTGNVYGIYEKLSDNADYYSEGIVIIDGNKNQIERMIPIVPFVRNVAGLTEIGLNSNSGLFYVGNVDYGIDDEVSSLLVLNGTTNSRTDQFELDITPDNIGVNPIAETIYLSEFESNETHVIDGSSGVTLKVFPFASAQFALNPNTSLIYITSFRDNAVYVVDAESDTLLNTEIRSGVESTTRGQDGFSGVVNKTTNYNRRTQ